MVTPDAKRKAVAYACEVHGVSQRRACQALRIDRSTVRYTSIRPDDAPLREAMKAVAAERRRFGYRRIHIMLDRQGIVMNQKKLRRLYREEKLQVRRRGGRKRALGTRRPMLVPDRANARWSLDFVSDTFTDGRRFRVLAVVDDYTRECLALIADTIGLSDRLCLIHGTHATAEERARLAASPAVLGLCPITEASLGDGIFEATGFRRAGGRLGVGTDSNVQIDAAGELRQLEYSQRLATGRRNCLAAPGGSTGRALLEAALEGGARALGRPAGIRPGAPADLVVLDRAHPDLEGRLDETAVACDDAEQDAAEADVSSSIDGPFTGYSKAIGFPDPRQASPANVREVLRQIIDRDGPLTRSSVYRLYVEGCPDLQRVGKIVRQALNRALGAMLRAGEIVQEDQLGDGSPDGQVLRIAGAPAVNARPAGRRDLLEIPPSELLAVLRRSFPAKTQPAGDNEALSRALLEHYGFSRLTKSRREYLSKVLRPLSLPDHLRGSQEQTDEAV